MTMTMTMTMTMECNKRLSFDGNSPGPSALRRLTRRRSSLDSSRSSSSISSITSDDSEINQSACVSREIAHNECALHRFIVWAAIKRNACDKMTSHEKRECPLLRCRKRFPNHELMLQHLYDCDQLASGEYWCYDCGKVERFTDDKCKRCLGHPSRRRKMMYMAKSFFGSLGHRSKNASSEELNLNLDEVLPPPSGYKFTTTWEPPQAELQSNEIHEIDSLEVSLPTIVEDEEGPDHLLFESYPAPPPASAPAPTPTPTPPPPAFHRRSTPSRAVELESAPFLTESLINWTPSPSPSPPTINPVTLYDPGQMKSPERPVLQLNTMGLDHYRAQAKRRSIMLAPSSSVRSTASTDSTNSTNSTNTTASYNISPMSAFSDAWAKYPGFDSTLTSPADDLVSSGGLLPTNHFSNSCKADIGNGGVPTEDSSDTFLSELPADIPMMMDDPLPTTSSDLLLLQDHLAAMNPSDFALDATAPAESSLDPSQAFINDTPLSPSMSFNPEPPMRSFTNPRALIRTSWDLLRMHVTDTMSKLEHLSNTNHLASQLRGMSAHLIVSEGLSALLEFLQGGQPDNPVKVLCFIHLAYAQSIAVYEQFVNVWCTGLFAQALSYRSCFSPQDSRAYVCIVDTLWRPKGMPPAEVTSILQDRLAWSESRSGPSDIKGKMPMAVATHSRHQDCLLLASQCFLDELELSTLKVDDQPDIQASELSIQHMGDQNIDSSPNSPFSTTVHYIYKMLSAEFSVFTDLSRALMEVLQRVKTSCISTPRRLELELMHAGKISLPIDTYLGNYVPAVRSHIDSLCEATFPPPNSRVIYYQHAEKLIRTTIDGVCGNWTTADNTKDDVATGIVLEPLDFVSSLSPGHQDNFNYENSYEPIPGFDLDTILNFPPQIIVNDVSTLPPQTTLQPGPISEDVSPAGPSTTAPSTSSPQGPTTPAASKTESNSCCNICGYRPKGDPKWFGGSMAKHKKLQHATSPPKMYQCPFPGCTSQYKNRPDNLRQHQIEKNHFVDGQEEIRRPSKRKKVE